MRSESTNPRAPASPRLFPPDAISRSDLCFGPVEARQPNEIWVGDVLHGGPLATYAMRRRQAAEVRLYAADEGERTASHGSPEPLTQRQPRVRRNWRAERLGSSPLPGRIAVVARECSRQVLEGVSLRQSSKRFSGNERIWRRLQLPEVAEFLLGPSDTSPNFVAVCL